MAEIHQSQIDALVVGGGPAGLTAAIALAAGGVNTALIAKRADVTDNRTTALLAGSVTALEMLGVWARCASYAEPLRVMRIVDDTGRLLRAPEVKFAAAEIGFEAFGQNIENRRLVAALEARARELSSLRIVEERVVAVVAHPDSATIRLEGGEELRAALVVGADGRQSLCRTAANIKTRQRDYPQSALALSFRHSRPHHDISTEFHTSSGPFTLVPLLGQRSSLVWVFGTESAADVSAMPDAALNEEIERRSHSILGKIRVEPGRSLFPLSLVTAECYAQNRIALVGEAAHVLPPIGAQGLNLGLRDAATIGELAIIARRAGGDIGGDAILTRYDTMRSADVGNRTLAVDLVNRSLLSDFLPVQGARGIGFYLVDRIAPLRHALMREGVAPSAAQPRLMRGEAL